MALEVEQWPSNGEAAAMAGWEQWQRETNREEEEERVNAIADASGREGGRRRERRMVYDGNTQ